ncbi:hypothetical protein GXM_05946 [Nostoc sphaeroides CCNUC1]|uniref:Uncharacterized protein n=1 Tax=Nostoc sphaeroides CCNUC1 TaxID=2653204 RepID=A0A5P8W7A7_9NOSO|nr:hypothetical protein GXM_05946 [Nostoc sphaeroides CCNUC1]
MSQTIDSCGVNPINAQIQSASDRFHRFLIILRSPTKSPSTSTDRPSSKADWGNVKLRITELFGLHIYFLQGFLSQLLV